MTEDKVLYIILGAILGSMIIVYIVNEAYREWTDNKKKGRNKMKFICIKAFKGLQVGEVWEMTTYMDSFGSKDRSYVWLNKRCGEIYSSVSITLDELYKHFDLYKEG